MLQRTGSLKKLNGRKDSNSRTKVRDKGFVVVVSRLGLGFLLLLNNWQQKQFLIVGGRLKSKVAPKLNSKFSFDK